MLFPHLASRLYGTPLLLVRSKLDVILSVLGDRVGWPTIDPAVQQAMALPAARTRTAMAPGVALVPVYGTLVRRSLGLEAASGLTSYAEVAAALDAAVADPAVGGILLDIDSPGGEAGGVFELAQRVRAANAVKPVWAVASDSAFSAAYAIACAASRVYLSQTAGVGSIGVIAMHVDQSARDAQEGYRYTAVTAGAHKNDFSPHEPFDPQALASLQAEVDRLYGLFVDHVAAMRGLDPAAVRATEAGLYFGPGAISAGLADRLGTTESAAAELADYLASRTSLPGGMALSRPLLPGRAASACFPVSNHPLENPEMTDSALDPHPDPHPDASGGEPIEPASPPASPELAEGVGATAASAVSAAASAAVAQARADAVAVAELCQLAGRPERTAAFLAEGTGVAEVRKALLADRAHSPEISSLVHPDAAASSEASQHNPLMKAVKKLTAKD